MIISCVPKRCSRDMNLDVQSKFWIRNRVFSSFHPRLQSLAQSQQIPEATPSHLKCASLALHLIRRHLQLQQLYRQLKVALPSALLVYLQPLASSSLLLTVILFCPPKLPYMSQSLILNWVSLLNQCYATVSPVSHFQHTLLVLTQGPWREHSLFSHL